MKAPDESTIVVVDDDYDSLEVIRRVLEAYRYKVSGYLDPMEALEHMAVQKPDLVITDLIMKSIDTGLSFARQIKYDPRFKDIPVILVTAAFTQREIAIQPKGAADLKKMGVDAYFDKPFSPEKLVGKVKELLALAMEGRGK